MATQAQLQAAAQTFQQRVTALQQTATQYISKEQTSITNTVSSMKAILNGRAGGAGVQQSNSAAIASIAFNDLTDFLQS